MSETEDDRRRRKVDEQKEIFDLATREWLDDKFRQFGRWSIYSMMAVIFILFLKGLFSMHMQDLRNVLQTTEQIQKLAN